MEDEKKWDAYHEAGHAVACCYFNCKMVKITIKSDPEKKTDGGCDCQEDSLTLDQLIIGLFSGNEAEARARGTEMGKGFSGDYFRAIVEVQKKFGNEIDASSKIIDLIPKSKELIEQNWDAVCAIADEIIKRETLFEKDVLEIYQKNKKN